MGGMSTFSKRTGREVDLRGEPSSMWEWLCNDVYLWSGTPHLEVGDVIVQETGKWVVERVVSFAPYQEITIGWVEKLASEA